MINSPLGADCHAFAAGSAFFGSVHKLGARILRFRIGAPGATKGTAFYENIGSDTWAVMDTVMLDIKNDAVVSAMFFGHMRDSFRVKRRGRT